jgi:hypothetical protein
MKGERTAADYAVTVDEGHTGDHLADGFFGE